MKKLGLGLILLTMMAVFFAPSAVSAQISDYTADFQIVNLSSSDTATIVITFYEQDGDVAATVNDTISADASKTYSPLPDSVPTGFAGSVVISSDQPIAAITNVKSSDSEFGSSYSSFASGSNTMSLPIINKDFYGINTWFNVQNTGSSDTDVTVTYSGTACTENATIKPGAAAQFDQASNGCLPSDYNGSATITADGGGTIAAIALQVASTGLFAYNGFASTAGSQAPVIPLVTNNVYGIHTGVQIQNQGGTDTEVTVTYSAGSGTGTDCTETGTIPAESALTFTINALSFASTDTTTTCTLGEYWIGSASVTTNSASQNLVAVVNQTNFSSNGGSSYGAFNPGDASQTIVMPLLMDAYNIWTGFSVMNVGSADTVTCTYSGTSISVSKSLGSNEAWAIQNVNGGTGSDSSTLPSSYVGSGTCTVAGGGSLLGVVNQANLNVTAGSGDGTLTYEAVNN